MHDKYTGWDFERAAAWLRRRDWHRKGADAEPAPAGEPASLHDTQADCIDDAAPHARCEREALDQIELACWPALVAPFYD
ncbi:MAG: hypothetical protein ACJ8GW_08750 [Massilia sp.]